MSDEDLSVRISGHDDTGAAFGSAKHHAENFAEAMHETSREVVGEAAKMIAEFFALEKAIEGIVEGIKKADELRDLANSLRVFAGGTKQATEALEFFEKQAAKTRNTADELAVVFRDLLPLSGAKGFTQEATSQITVMLSQLATMRGQSLETMESGFTSLLAGRVTVARNELLKSLGIKKEDVDSLGWDHVTQKLEEVTSHFGEFGQSWESTMHKAKDSLLEAFGAGFNEARADADSGMAGINAAVETFKPVLHDLGKNMAELGPSIVASMEGAAGAMRILFGGLQTSFGLVLSGIAGGLSGFDHMMGDIGHGLPSWMKAVFKLQGIDIDGGASQLDRVAATFGAVANSGQDMAVNGAENVRAGIEMIANAQRTATEGFKAAHAETTGIKEDIHGIPSGLIVTAKAAKSTAEALKEAHDTMEKMLKLLETNSGLKKIWGYSPDLTPLGGASPMAMLVDPAIADATMAHAKAVYMKDLADAFAAETNLKLHDYFTGELANAFVGIAERGGKGFMDALSQNFHGMVAEGGKIFAAAILGKRGDGAKDAQGNYLPGHDPGQIYGGALGPKGTQVASGAVDALSIGMGGYSAGLSGQPGSRTSATMSGAMAGAGFGPWGMVVGAILGAIGGAMGAAQRQKDYQYLNPQIDKDGNVSITQGRNLGDGESEQIRRRIQQEFDTIHDAFVKTLLKFPASIIPALTAIDGKIQDNPSAYIMKHLGEWESGKLPEAIAAQFKGSFQKVFESVGFSVDRFGEIWDKLGKLDPKMAPQLLGSLLDSLQEMKKYGDFFKAGSRAAWSAMGAEGHMSPGEVLAKNDAEILHFAEGIKNLSLEGQIAALAELKTMEQQRYENEKKALQELYQLSVQVRDQFRSFNETLDVQGLTGADGKQDNYKTAQYYHDQLQGDLSAIQYATNATDLNKAWAKYQRDVQMSEQYGLAQANPADRQKWIDNARTEAKQGFDLFNATVGKIGQGIDQTAATFTDKLDPILDLFTGKLAKAGDGLDGIIDPIDKLPGKIDRTGDALDRFITKLDAFTVSGRQRFAAVTVARR